MFAKDIRDGFLNFFANNGHRIVDSSSVVPQNDPSLLFTNAGMVQFKSVFTGLETRDYLRATTSQKCIRAGGKHNDLDQVGFTARHHTFFEMLGNFSFGDYFKEDALNFAWTFLTKELSIPKSKLLVTIFHTDEEAKSIWKKIAGEVRIIPIATSDNFWSMGDIGPCGPCSEIFYDYGESVFGDIPGSSDQNGDRYMEIWNIVFMQFEQISGGKHMPLQKKSIDTGMGLERISAIMQGVQDNYLTDLFAGIIDEVKSISSTNFANTYPSYKVVADHIRSVSFLITDGVLPSNEGRGYVLRRILRRAMRHGNMIGIGEPFLFKLSGIFIDTMKSVYPELEKAREMISSTIHQEEEKFLDTLDRGLKILQSDLREISPGGVLSGDKAFKLYDTYGFPLDLTQDILKTNDISVDIKGFETALQEQKNRAKWTGSGEQKEAEIWHNMKEKFKTIEFIGYEKDSCHSEILAIVRDEEEVSVISAPQKACLITKSTPFYAECGGQCGDIGIAEGKNGVFRVTATKKFCDDIIIHEGEVISGRFQRFDDVILSIDAARRSRIRANHTATHLLQAALRSILGNHVVQRGSFINDERLRFDFSHSSALSPTEIASTEDLIVGWILQDSPVTCCTMTKNDAIAAGATALFGEKYGEMVRTVSIASAASSNIDNATLQKTGFLSFELCGGTHARTTGCIGLFKIISETSIGSGVRRIEAITGKSVLDYLRTRNETIAALMERIKCGGEEELPKRIDALLAELKQRTRDTSLYKQKAAIDRATEVEITGATVYSLIVEDFSQDEVRALGGVALAKKKSGIIIIENVIANQTFLSVLVSGDLLRKYPADKILRGVLGKVGGKGGGSAASAQGSVAGKLSLLTATVAMAVSIAGTE
ncbi:MAG: alanine--tRNA ligase [Holosporaceae bacterium]|jgi:alanyl-tRNA synthetase|nr:alanine--tRNA ligase [Holosporaceae bacterium]